MVFAYNSIETNFNFSKKILIIPSISTLIKNQSFASNLTNTTDEDLFINEVAWRQVKSALSVDWIYKTDYFKMQLTTPFNYYFFNRGVEINNLSFFTFEPMIRLKYDINNNWKWLYSSKFEKEFGNMRSYFPNLVIINYRKLELYNRQFENNSFLKLKVSLQYENLFNSLFGSLSYSYSVNDNNLIYTDNYFTNGGLITSTDSNSNNKIRTYISSRISKRFTRKWLISLTGQYVTNTFQREVNDQVLDIENISKELVAEANLNPNEAFDFNLSLKSSFIKSFLFSRLNQDVTQLQYKAGVLFYKSKHQLNVTGEFFTTYPEIVDNLFFLDISWKYNFTRQSCIMVTFDNIFNRTIYETFTTDGFTIVENYFELRPTQVYLTATFIL